MRRIGLLLFAIACSRREAEVAAPPVTATSGTTVVTTTMPPPETRAASEVPDRDLYLERARIGSEAGPDGTVAGEKTTFAKGEPVRVTLWLKKSPPGLQTSVRWFASDGKELAHELRQMEGAKVVTFVRGGFAPGRYRVETRWGGNVAAEYEFDVRE